MSPEALEFRQRALTLSAEDRIELAEELLSSVAAFASPEIEKAWMDESERRLADLKAGKTTSIPAEEVFRKIRAKMP